MQAIHEHNSHDMFDHRASFSQTVGVRNNETDAPRARFAGGLSLRIYVGSLTVAALIALALQAFAV